MKRQCLRITLAMLVVGLVTGQGCPTGGGGLPPGDGNGSGGSSSASCDGGDGYGTSVERIGVIQSTDGGVTWTFLGHACLHATGMTPVDPAPRFENGQVVLYFYDLSAQSPGSSSETQVMYRAVSDDYLDFSTPTAAYSTTELSMTDPEVALLPDGTYRMFVSAGTRVPSASSSDGVTFAADDGYRSEVGGVPGALVLPDGRVRLFVCGNGGIVSLISDDGLEFESESGVRIAASDDEMVCDPDPVRLRDGSYMMAYKIRPAGETGPNDDEVYLATSTDGLDWATIDSPIVTGSVPGLVQLDDGTLLVYYVDFSAG